MVKTLTGDLFSSRAQTLVNTVNTVGVMGKGVALEFKRRFPEMYDDYRARCERGEVKLGRPYLFKREGRPWVLNFPTKAHWRGVSSLDAIKEGLRYLALHYHEWGIESLAVPPLGCGLGQLDWTVVGPTLYRGLESLNIDVELYAPFGTPADQLTLDFFAPKVATRTSGLEASWIALAAAIDIVGRKRFHNPVGRVTFQKLAYFATNLGIPTGLTFRRNSYGPFSSEVKPIIARLVNNGVLREEKLGKMFALRVGPAYRDAVGAHRSLLTRWKPEILRVVDLILRMTTDQAELAATVIFVARENAAGDGSALSERDVFEGVKSWKSRRRPPLRDENIGEAVRALNALSWVNLRYSAELPLPPFMRDLSDVAGDAPELVS